MNPDRILEVREVCAELHGYTDTLGDLPGVRSEVVEPDDAHVLVLVAHELAEALVLGALLRDGPLQRRELEESGEGRGWRRRKLGIKGGIGKVKNEFSAS